jgi:hypothetical protein
VVGEESVSVDIKEFALRRVRNAADNTGHYTNKNEKKR